MTLGEVAKATLAELKLVREGLIADGFTMAEIMELSALGEALAQLATSSALGRATDLQRVGGAIPTPPTPP